MINNYITVQCTGCRACEQKCPKHCIEMKDNQEGFLYPHVDIKQCNNCGFCVKTCHQLAENLAKEVGEVYAARAKDDEILLKSSSGGMFTILAQYALRNEGIVYGCAFDKNMVARHVMVDSLKGLDRLRGSKYVQSDTADTFGQAKQFLNKGMMVLYSGTPCQIAGLKSYLGREYENLLTADLICHGVPSQKLFNKYITWFEKKTGQRIIKFDFRSKDKNKWGLMYKVQLSNSEKYKMGFLDPYYKSFLEGKTYRECCYHCKYATAVRIGDITIADYWGIEKQHPEFYTDKGVSLILINTQKGRQVFDKIKADILYLKSTVEQAVLQNENLRKPVRRPVVRDSIYNEIDNLEFSSYINKYLSVGLQPMTRIKAAVPYKVKLVIKKILR
ncbi:Coenzyme F420 hydrogenase/dehydrogenase, beta subunit C-terminal domain [Desulfosporosinus sp. BG]|uniref:Coenzyme F420 hydrogenase/dehydrogenase, beta subunit C-terminal domain n=1 Tax=Desulfosporosinus sp. BG TaxID=1633135 RepID=UPI00083B2BA8|nr:Coenzyme F420 hydrogenase/dehydrogenase, beta subunit C-terminal domain [Desulfosporosinus sp. BG]ODA40296.1 Coenzyme F420-reducing hydrogenase, beta subunit [Desulfosporosinus sp. BG]